MATLFLNPGGGGNKNKTGTSGEYFENTTSVEYL